MISYTIPVQTLVMWSYSYICIYINKTEEAIDVMQAMMLIVIGPTSSVSRPIISHIKSHIKS